jgi:adenosylmethionine-8-amino-7-oxononanoate aminotransferase
VSRIFHRSLTQDLPTVVAGEGNYLLDSTGRRYLDACGGAAVSCLGHGEARVTDAIAAQLRAVPFAHTSFFTTDPAEELAAFLTDTAPPGMGQGLAMFLGSGSEAMEAALKLVRQVHLERGEPARRHIIARRFSYHGNTLGALAIGGHAGRRAPFQPLLMEAHHIDPCHAYRFRRDDETEAAFARRMADQLEATILALGPDSVAAFVAEPVVGATLGTQPAAPGYFARIREICDRHGVLFVADEVMCGMGRTGTLHAMEQEGTHADIVTLAKGLGAGYQPIAAVLASERVVDAVRQGSGRLWNGHTYMSHAAACAGALAVQRVIAEDGLLANVRAMGDRLAAGLHDRLSQDPNVGDIRGRGLFRSIELVADRETKAPFPATDALAPRIREAALDAGLMCYPSQGCVDGTAGDHILLAPSYTSTPDEIALIVDRLGQAVDTALGRT